MGKSKRRYMFLSFALIVSVLLGCGQKQNDGSSSNSSSLNPVSESGTSDLSSSQESSQNVTSSQPSNSTPSSSTSQGEVLSPIEYEESLSFAPWTKANHLYIHYYRENQASLENWALWVWQKVPKDLAGFRVDYFRKDQSGIIFEVDLNDVRLAGVTKLGFLIVLKSSMEQTAQHWTSDSGGNVYIDDIPNIKRTDGTIHIFTTEGRSSLYTKQYEGLNVQNPYEGDTGQLESVANVNSSDLSKYGRAKTSVDFKENAVVGYQIQVATFADSNGDGIGDIRGIIAKLPYLKDLNVNAIWLTPIQDSESYHGYDTIDYYKIDRRFGTLADYRELIFEAHKLDMRIIMDLVLNHTSINNHWFIKSAQVAQGKDINDNNVDYRSLYHWKYSTTPLSAPWYKFADTNYYYYGKFASSMPELNYDNQLTRDFMVDVAKYWAGFGVDGFRIDAVKHVYMADEVTPLNGDTITEDGEYSANLTKNLNFFKEFSNRVKNVYPDTFIVGENFDGWDQRISPYLQGMDSLLDFPAYYHFVNNNFYNFENSAFTEANNIVFEKINMFNTQRGDKAILSSFTSNHDVERMINHVNNLYAGSGASVSETHRPIGNGNAIEAIDKTKAYAASIMLQPGLSFIYYGDELGMSGNIEANDGVNSPSDAIGEDWNEDRWYRQPMKWADSYAADPYSISEFTFSGYKLYHDDYNKYYLDSVVTQETKTNSMLNFFKSLTAFKNEYKAFFASGTYEKYTGPSLPSHAFAYALRSGSQKLTIIINHGDEINLSGISGQLLLNLNNGNNTSALRRHGVVVYMQ